MDQKYDIRTLYPIVQTHLPLTVKPLFNESDQTLCPQIITSMHDREEIRSKLCVPKPPGQAGCISHGGYSLERQQWVYN